MPWECSAKSLYWLRSPLEYPIMPEIFAIWPKIYVIILRDIRCFGKNIYCDFEKYFLFCKNIYFHFERYLLFCKNISRQFEKNSMFWQKYISWFWEIFAVLQKYISSFWEIFAVFAKNIYRHFERYSLFWQKYILWFWEIFAVLQNYILSFWKIFAVFAKIYIVIFRDIHCFVNFWGFLIPQRVLSPLECYWEDLPPKKCFPSGIALPEFVVPVFRHACVSSTYPCPLVGWLVGHTFEFPISGR